MPEPVLLCSPPPVHRDRMVQAWVLASSVSWMGNAAWTVALAWFATQHLTPAMAGMVVAISTAPQALLTVAGGLIADRYDTRIVMTLGQVMSALTLAGGALLLDRLPLLWVLTSVGIAFGVVSGLTQPAAATLFRQLVPGEDLATVSGWNQIAARLARLAGAPLGAWLVATRGLAQVMLLDAATFVIVAVMLIVVVRPRYRLRSDQPPPWFAALREAAGYLRRDAAARTLVIGLCGLNVFSAPLMSIGVPIRITNAGWEATVLGMAEAVFAGCAIAGSILGLVVRPRRRALAAFALLAVQGASYGLIAVRSQTAVFVGLGVIGLIAGLTSVWLSSEFVLAIEPRFLGRVSSLSTLGDLLLIPLATPAFGALTSSIGISTSPLILAVGMTLLCLTIVAQPSIRRDRA